MKLKLPFSSKNNSKKSQTLGYVAALENIALFYHTLVNIFGIIFFYGVFAENILLATAIIAMYYFISALIPFFNFEIIGRIGTRNSLYIFLALVFASTFLILEYSDSNSVNYAIAWYLLLGLARTFYVGPVVYIVGQNTTHESRGRDVSVFASIQLISSVTAPLFGALIGDIFGFETLYIAASLILLLGVIPASKLPNYKFDFSFDLRKVFSSKRGRRIINTNIVRFLPQQWAIQLWSLYIFLQLGDISEVGFIIAMTTGLSLLSISFFSKLLDKERNKPFRIASTINAIVNVGRGLLINFAPIIVWDYFGRLGETLRLQTGLTNSYDMITDKVEPEHKDELNALHTITANFFIGVGLIIGGLVVHFFSFAAGFVLIAVVNLSAYLIRFNSDDFH